MSQSTIQAQTLFDHLKAPLGLSWIGGKAGADRIIRIPLEPDSILGGRLDWIYPPKIQILGQEEFLFLDTLDEATRNTLIRRLLTSQTGALIVCDRQRTEALHVAADETSTPLWHASAPPVEVLERLAQYQRDLGETSTLIHGELLEVFGLGILITGASGTGKSELALELISRGHRLIADDTPQLTRVATNVIEGTCPSTLRDFLEVRGLGILNIRRMFGDSAIKRNKRVRLVIQLVRPNETSIPAELRLHGARDTHAVLDVSIPKLDLPIAPGRNLAVLVECAVRDHIQRLAGYHAEQDLTARLQTEMAREITCG